jgi:hypothetical protein
MQLFLVARFVTYSDPNKKSKSIQAAGKRRAEGDLDMGTPSPASNGLSTPTANGHSNVGQEMNAADEDGLVALTARLTPEGNAAEDTTSTMTATVHCTSVSQLCFKHGRITVPPAIALATNGYSSPPPSSSSPSYSHDNPPPHWSHVRPFVTSPKDHAAFMRGEWRNVREGERWWEGALGGVVEEQRRANMEVLVGVRKGLSDVANVGVFAGNSSRQVGRDRHTFGIGSFI